MKVRELIAQLQDDIDPEAEIVAVRALEKWPRLAYDVSGIQAYRGPLGPIVELLI